MMVDVGLTSPNGVVISEGLSGGVMMDGIVGDGVRIYRMVGNVVGITRGLEGIEG